MRVDAATDIFSLNNTTQTTIIVSNAWPYFSEAPVSNFIGPFRVRQQGAPHVALAHDPEGKFDVVALVAEALALWERDPFDLVVIDEASMLSLNLAAQLFKRIRSGSRVLLIGDPNQLPAVGPGDEITATAEVLEARDDKPMTKLKTWITNQDDVTVLDGDALVWTDPLDS